jgi:hypothetical protein
MKEKADRATDQVIRAGVEMFQRNAGIVQRALNSSAQLTSVIAERSFDQFERAFGVSAEDAEKGAQRCTTNRAFGVSVEDADKGSQRSSTNMEGSSSNMEAIVQSGTILTELMQRMCEEWGELGRARMERSFDRMCALMQSRTPQDAAAVQSEMLRDNIETFLGFARKAGECSARLSDATRRVGSLAEGHNVVVSFPFLGPSLASGNSRRDE